MIFGKHINRYYLRYSLVLLIGIASLVLVNSVQLKIPALYQYVINGINEGSVILNGARVAFDMDFVLDQICLPMIGVVLSLIAGRFLWRVCFFGSGIRLETDLRNRMFNHAKDLSREYYQVNRVGNLMSLFTNDLDTVQECFSSGILMFFDATMLGILAIRKMLQMDTMLTLFAMIPMLFLLCASLVLGRHLTQRWNDRQAAFSALSEFAQESFSGIAVIKAFVKESRELMTFREHNRQNEKTNVDHTRSATLLRLFVLLFVESVICVILGYGGYLVYIDRFNAGQLIEFIGYFNTVIWPVMAVSEIIELTSRGRASLARISELLDAPITVIDRPTVTEIPPVTGKIEFRNLTFRYPDGELEILRDVSLTINPGEHVGIVGKTGSGKTTLVDLILRTYNVPDGTLFLDDHDVNTIPIRQARDACAYVPQDNFLFSDTIARNIAFGHDEIDLDTVSASAKFADVDENIVAFKDGYQTVLGERGVTVSGGQKQRISIARALMKDAPILILDDSVSAVDTATEKIILDNLRRTRTGRTTLLIAHRISTIERMDKIIFLGDGKILAIGTHDELCANCPDYRHMVELQRLEAEGGDEQHA